MKAAILCAVLFSMLVYVQPECLDTYGSTMHTGDVYIGLDHCNQCRCLGDADVCTRMFCMPGHSRCMAADGRIYNEGQSFPAADGCNTCVCEQDGMVSCTEMWCGRPAKRADGQCEYDGQLYRVGQSFPSSDNCNTCGCSSNGMVFCTLRACLTLG